MKNSKVKKKSLKICYGKTTLVSIGWTSFQMDAVDRSCVQIEWLQQKLETLLLNIGYLAEIC